MSEQQHQEDADRAVMSLEAMAFHWIDTTEIHTAIDAASRIAGPQNASRLASCIHGLVSQAWIEGADTGFQARKKLSDAYRDRAEAAEAIINAALADAPQDDDSAGGDHAE